MLQYFLQCCGSEFKFGSGSTDLALIQVGEFLVDDDDDDNDKV